MVAAPVVGNLPYAPMAGFSYAAGTFFYFSEGVRRAMWRRKAFPDTPPPAFGVLPLVIGAAWIPTFAVMMGSWTAYGLMSWKVFLLSLLGIAHVACMIAALDALVSALSALWRDWFFNAMSLCLQPMFLFGLVFRPDFVIAARLYALSLFNPLVAAIEPARIALTGASHPSYGSFAAWVPVWASVIFAAQAFRRRPGKGAR